MVGAGTDQFSEGVPGVEIPTKFTMCGLPGALSLIVSVAALIPTAVGVKLTFKVQLTPIATEPPATGHVVPLAIAKSLAAVPERENPTTDKLLVPVSPMLIDCTADVEPTG